MLLAFAFIYLRNHQRGPWLPRFHRATANGDVGELAAVLGKFVEGIMRISESTLILRASPRCCSGHIPRLRHQGADLAVPHVRLPMPTPGANRRFHGSCRDPAEDGVYGFLRIVLPISHTGAAHVNVLLLLALATIVFGAYAALAQTDFKRLVAYSSVNHMGYAMLGIFVTVATAAM